MGVTYQIKIASYWVKDMILLKMIRKH